jgi:hypothetical protein
VRPGRQPVLSPGLPRLRLWTDTASRLFGIEQDERGIRKQLIDQLDPAQVETGTVPFRAAYVLDPVTEGGDAAPATRDRLEPVAATMALVMHSKLGPILTGPESPVVLALAADIARSVPVYALHVVRDLARVDEVAQLLYGWHAGEDLPSPTD